MVRKMSQGEFITRVKAVHVDKFDLSKTVYGNYHDKVIVSCGKHGDFMIAASGLLSGKGCKRCANEKLSKTRSLTREKFLEKSKLKHGDKYDYSLVCEVSSFKDIVTVICPTHGAVEVQAREHYTSTGCTVCGRKKSSDKRRSSTEEFIKKAIAVHGDKYDYSKCVYITSKDKMEIICRKHESVFLQDANGHLRGNGCPKCKWDKILEAKFIGTEEFIRRSKTVHGDKYSYDRSNYIGYQLPITVTCGIHGDFEATPDNILHGSGCSKCGSTASQVEDRIADELESFTRVLRRDKSLLGGRREIDIYLPDLSLAIEYNGGIWHSERFHKNPKYHMRDKIDSCNSKGVRLVQVMDYEKEEVIIKTLRSICGFSKERTYARKCRIFRESFSSVKDFLEKNHLQGSARGGVYYSLRFDLEIKAVMVFSRMASERGSRDSSRFELRRYCSTGRVVGGASKLLKSFLRDFPECKYVVSYSDNRWFTGGMYERLGFKMIKEVPIDYKYIDGNGKIVQHKGQFRRSRLRKRNDFDFVESESEIRNCHDNNWWRLWDCGKKKWVLEV